MSEAKRPRGKSAPRPKKVDLPADHKVSADVEEKQLEWLIEGRIPRSLVTMVAGRPGQGKSLFTAWLAAHISSQGHGVLFSNLEDLEAEVTRPRLRVAGADLNHVHFWTPDLSTAEGLGTLELMVKALGIKLLVIDPLSAHLPKKLMDDRAAIRPITELCERTGLSIVALHHTRKGVSKNGHPLDAVKGAGDGFMAAARFVYIFGRNVDDEDERVLAAAKTNVAEEGSMTFHFDLVATEIAGEETEIPRLVLADPASDVSPMKLLEHGMGDSKGDPAKRAVAAEWLTSQLMFGEVNSNELKDKAAQDGISWRTVRRAAEKIGVEKRAEGRGFGEGRDYFYRLPDGHPALKVGAAAAAATEEGLELPQGQVTVEDVLRAIDAHGTVPEPSEEDGDDA